MTEDLDNLETYALWTQDMAKAFIKEFQAKLNKAGSGYVLFVSQSHLNPQPAETLLLAAVPIMRSSVSLYIGKVIKEMGYLLTEDPTPTPRGWYYHYMDKDYSERGVEINVIKS